MAYKDEVGSLDRIAAALEAMNESEENSSSDLPSPTEDDAGKILTVGVDGKYTLVTLAEIAEALETIFESTPPLSGPPEGGSPNAA